MLSKLFKRRGFKKQSSLPDKKISALKPLTLKTVYRQQYQPEEPSSSTQPQPLWQQEQQRLIGKRYSLLVKDEYFQDTNIELCTLNQYECLIGLTKHKQTILSGIFMYPEMILSSHKWPLLEKQADELKTGIAMFTTLHPINCLKVTQNGNETSVFYLIDHRAIERTEWLKHPPTVKG